MRKDSNIKQRQLCRKRGNLDEIPIYMVIRRISKAKNFKCLYSFFLGGVLEYDTCMYVSGSATFQGGFGAEMSQMLLRSDKTHLSQAFIILIP